MLIVLLFAVLGGGEEGGRGERRVKKEEVSEEVGKEELGISKNEQGEVDKLFISYHLRVCL